MKKIFYVGYYDIKENESENRNYVLTATNKMTYIISAIENAGFETEVISPAWTHNKKSYDGKRVSIGERSSLLLFKTLPWGNGVRRVISRHSIFKKLEKYLKNTLTSDDTVIVYHSMSYADMLIRLKKKIGFKLILELEEIYADVFCSESVRRKEYALFDVADSFIFSTELLSEKANRGGKPFVPIYGTYHAEECRNETFDDGKIHCVFAGSLDPRKGAGNAVRAMEYLSSDYVLHVLGKGHAGDLFDIIEDVNQKDCGCVVFDGYLSGEDYISLIQKCHIGFCTQNIDATFNNTSFPSKILSYLANGLRVVSCRIKTIEASKIGDMMYFYGEDLPVAIADTIKKIDIDAPYDSRARIQELDDDFVRQIKKILSE